VEFHHLCGFNQFKGCTEVDVGKCPRWGSVEMGSRGWRNQWGDVETW
jgi:hypothetical protein